MLNLILVLLVLMWLAGMVTLYTLGGFLHLLLLLAVAIFLIRIDPGPQPRRLMSPAGHASPVVTR